MCGIDKIDEREQKDRNGELAKLEFGKIDAGRRHDEDDLLISRRKTSKKVREKRDSLNCRVKDTARAVSKNTLHTHNHTQSLSLSL